MKKLIVTDHAKQDLRQIRHYIAEHNPEEALLFIADLTAKIAWIAEADFKGSSRDHISEGLRGFPYRKRCIYFRIYEEHIVIVRILHSRQDLAKQSFGEND